MRLSFKQMQWVNLTISLFCIMKNANSNSLRHKQIMNLHISVWLGRWSHRTNTHTHTHQRAHAHIHTDRDRDIEREREGEHGKIFLKVILTHLCLAEWQECRGLIVDTLPDLFIWRYGAYTAQSSPCIKRSDTHFSHSALCQVCWEPQRAFSNTEHSAGLGTKTSSSSKSYGRRHIH